MSNTKLALVAAGSLLTVNGQAFDEEVTTAYNSIAEKLNTETKPQDFIQSRWVQIVPIQALTSMAVERLRAGLPVPTILAKAVGESKECKKLLVAARKDRKQYLVKNQRTVVSALIDSGYQLGKVDMKKAHTPDKRGNMHVDLRFTKGAKPEVTDEDKAAVIAGLSPKQLRELLAKAEATEAEQSAPEASVTVLPTE